MNFELDGLSWDILNCLRLTPGNRLRRKEIRDLLTSKYSYGHGSFDVVFQRRLYRLGSMGLLKRQERGYQKVYYYIPKAKIVIVSENLDRRFFHKKFDEIWDQMTQEQRKKSAQNLAQEQGLIIQLEKHMSGVFSDFIKELSAIYVTDLEKPTESTPQRFSAEQRQELLTQLRNVQEEAKKIDSNMKNEDRHMKEKLQERIDLAMDFTNKVVDPIYGGQFNVAIEDLMRKAIEAQDMKNSN